MKRLTGTPRENEKYIEEMIREHDAAGRKLMILVPSEYTLETEKMLFRVTDAKALFDLSVASTKQFVSRLTGERPSELPAALVRMILGRALGETELYHGLVSEGVELSLADFVRRWRENNPRVSLPEVQGGALLREKMACARTAMEALFAAEKDLVPYETLLEEATTIVREMRRTDETILVRGVTDGMKERTFFHALDEKFELVIETDDSSVDYRDAEMVPLPTLSPTVRTADVFETPTEAWEEVAAWILEDLKRGIPPEEITVHVGDLDGNLDEAGRIFAEFGIDFALDKRHRAEEFPIGRFFHGVLTVLKDRTALSLEVFTHLPYGNALQLEDTDLQKTFLDETTPIFGPYFVALDKAETFGEVLQIYTDLLKEPIFFDAITDAGEENERIWNLHLAELRAYNARFGAEKISVKDALERILSGLQLLDVGVLPIEGNLVRLTSMGRVLGTAQVRYLIGLDEEAMRESDARFFFGYDEIREGAIAIPGAEENDREAERELRRLLESAERIHMTCARREKGRTVVPHAAMKDLPSHGLVGSISYARGLFELPREKRAAWMAAYGKESVRRRERVEEIEREASDVIATTALEQFARCPYRYFARYELGLDTPFDLFGRAMYGTILHALFAAYTAERRKGNVDIPTFAHGFFERWLSETEVPEHQKDAYETYLTLYEEAGVRALVRIEEMLAQSDLTVVAEERPFAVDMPNGMRVAGRIDRIDETGAGKLVIDYKTGAKAFSAESAEALRDAQLLFYLASIAPEERAGAVYLPIGEGKFSGFLAEDDDILTRVEKTPGANLGQGFYTSTGARSRDMQVATREEVNAVVDFLLGRAELLLEAYLAGDVTAKKEKIAGAMSCDYCPYEALCGTGDEPFVEGDKISWRELVKKSVEGAHGFSEKE